MKRIISILFLIVSFLTVRGQEPAEDLVRKVAGSLIVRTFPASDYNISGVRSILDSNIKTMFIVDLSPEGWILVSADKKAEPLIGFSFTGTYTVPDKNLQNPHYVWMNNYSNQIKAIRLQKSTYENPAWSDFSKSAIESKGSASDIWVTPFIKVTWDQGKNWNQFCPADPAGPGGHVYAGCVAVAMSQAMSSFMKPLVGKGTYSYSPPGYEVQFVDYGAASYKWDSMSLSAADKYNSLLIYHSAVSVSMNFGADASGALITDASLALKKYFYYSRRITTVKRLVSDQDWMNLLNTELLKGHPLIYAGDADNGTAGHAFNIDGVVNGIYYHINWGWNGSNNGYYTINTLKPGTNDFTKNNYVITGIQPFYYPTDVVMSDTIVPLNSQPGKTVGGFRVVDEATDNVYTINLKSDSTFNGTSWVQDFYLAGDSVKTGRVFTSSDPVSDTIVFTVSDIHGNVLTKKRSLRIGTPSTGVNPPEYYGKLYSLLYPNPATDYIYINSIPGTDISSLFLYSVSGVLKLQVKNPSPGDPVSINFLPQGIYIYEARLKDGKVIRGKIIIR